VPKEGVDVKIKSSTGYRDDDGKALVSELLAEVGGRDDDDDDNRPVGYIMGLDDSDMKASISGLVEKVGRDDDDDHEVLITCPSLKFMFNVAQSPSTGDPIHYDKDAPTRVGATQTPFFV
jgi:hypothetical protein